MKLKSVLLEELSWREIGEAMEGGCRTVLVCAASNEQHGPHLAENTDYIFGLEMCRAVAEKMGDALVAPVIRPGLSQHHMRHPGSLTLRPETFRMLVEDYVDCYVRHGFERIVLLASHGTNFAPLAALAPELQKKIPPDKDRLRHEFGGFYGPLRRGRPDVRAGAGRLRRPRLLL